MDPTHDPPPPPYSETDIYSQPGNLHTPPASAPTADDTFSSSTGDVQYTPPQTPTTSRSVLAEPSPAVAAFFDSRPAPSDIPSERLEHTVTINAETGPEDLALQPGFTARGVTEQDWRTFVNFLLPDHAARSNESVAERKLRAASGEGSARGDAEAQLGSIRSDDGSQSHSAPRREDLGRTVEEWNVFFFRPRAISIRLSPEQGARQMPGAWDQAFDHKSGDADTGAADASAARDTANQRSWGIGGIRVTQDGISIGNMIEARRGGIRVGQLTADQSGISYAGRSLAAVPGPAMASRGYGGHYSAAGPTQEGSYEPRGGEAGAPGADRCNSSSGSSSSSDSESEDGDAIEELLDYDELLEGEDDPNADQYNMCSEALQRWLSSPDRQLTTGDLQALRQQMRALSRQGGRLSRPERKERKKELKTLIKAVRNLAKRQKQERREVRRQERQQRRAGRRERRQQKREVRRARREQRREGRRGHACGVSAPSQPSAPQAPPGVPGVSFPAAPPAPPGVPGVPYPPAPPGRHSRHLPPMPPWPPTPEAAAAHTPRLHIPAIPRGGHRGHPFGGRGRPFGAYHGRDSFFPHHVAPYGWPPAGPSGQDFHRHHHQEGYSRGMKKLEDRVVERTAALSKLESEMASNPPARGWGARRMEGRKHALEKEIEALQMSMEGLRMSMQRMGMQADCDHEKSAAEGGPGGAAKE